MARASPERSFSGTRISLALNSSASECLVPQMERIHDYLHLRLKKQPRRATFVGVDMEAGTAVGERNFRGENVSSEQLGIVLLVRPDSFEVTIGDAHRGRWIEVPNTEKTAVPQDAVSFRDRLRQEVTIHQIK